MFFCETCLSHFTRKTSFDKHNYSLKHIQRVQENAKHKCECGKFYMSSSSLSTHRKSCTAVHPPANNNEFLKVTEYEEEKEMIKRQIAELMEKYETLSTNITTMAPTTNNNNTTNNNTTNIGTQNNVNIHINAFGKENLDYITDGILNECANKVYASIPTLIENIHFNPKHPENHNIKITNKKLPHASVMTEDKEWKLMDKNELIDNMMDTGYMLIDDNFKDDPTQFTEERRRQYRRYQENYEKEDKETMKRIKSDVQYAILNGTKKIHSKEPNKNQYKA